MAGRGGIWLLTGLLGGGMLLASAGRGPVRWVSTYAGAEAGFSDGALAGARFNNPTGLAFDARDPRRPLLYVADTYNHRIRCVDLAAPGGPQARTIAGAGAVSHAGGGNADGPGDRATFRFPRDVAFDGEGRLFVADTNNHRVRMIDLRDPARPVTTVAGGVRGARDGAGRAARFSNPWGLAHDGAGHLYVADTYNDRIRRIDLRDGRRPVTTLAGGAKGYEDGPGARARFDGPVGLVVDRRAPGRPLYVADTANRCIRRLDMGPGGANVTTLGGTPRLPSEDELVVTVPLMYPASVAVDANGTVYASDQASNTVYRVSTDGSLETLAGIAGRAGDMADGSVAWARFRQPAGLAIDPDRGVFVADVTNHRIRLLSR